MKKTGSDFKKKVLDEYEITNTHDLERLDMASKCLNDLEEAEKRLKADGMFTVNRYGNTVEHPAMRTIKDLRLLFIKIVREMGLDLTTAPESRPPKRY